MIKYDRIIPVHHQLSYNHGIHLVVIDALCGEPSEDAVGGLSTDSDDDETDSNNSNNNNSECEIDNEITIMDEEPVQFCGSYKPLLQKVRSIVKLFKASPLKNNILQKYIKDEFGSGKELTLLLDCRTRWNSTQIMIERFLNLKKSITKSLIDLQLEHLFLNEHEIRNIESLSNVLKPIKMAVDELSSRDANLLTSEGVFKFLFESLEAEQTIISKILLEKLKTRLQQRRNNDIISVITFLQNPSILKSKIGLGSIAFFKMNSKSDIQKTIKELASHFFMNFDSDDDGDMDVEAQEQTTGVSLSDKLKKSIENYLKPMIVKEKNNHSYNKEINVYEDTGVISPNLRKILEYLKTIQPTSTESERVFSMASNTVTIKRQRLNDDSLNAILFLKSYFRNEK